MGSYAFDLLMAIALLCQATPGTTSTGSGTLWLPDAVKASQAKCQQRLIKCLEKETSQRYTRDDLISCIKKGVVFDPKESESKK